MSASTPGYHKCLHARFFILSIPGWATCSSSSNCSQVVHELLISPIKVLSSDMFVGAGASVFAFNLVVDLYNK